MPERRHRRAARAAAAFALTATLAIALAPVASAGPRDANKRQEANERQKRPNVIVVMTDDQSNSLLGMSNVAGRLASRGTTFRNSYVSLPLCCPSRATFLTGRYAHNHGVTFNFGPTAGNTGYHQLDHRNTLAVWLRRAGYRTALVGKYLNGYGMDDGAVEPLPDAREIPPGWTEWYALTGGSDQYRYRYKLNENGDARLYGYGPANYQTDVLASKAIDFIKRRGPSPKPFFLWFTPTAPHGEAGRMPGATRDPTPALRHIGRYEGAQAPRTPNFDEADVSDKPEFVRDEDPLTPEQIADIDVRYRGGVESLLSVDEAVGRIVSRLRKTGELRRTYIVFTSDNGLALGAHRLLFKEFLYEESLRVPLIIRGPKIPAGAVRNQLVTNVDLAPTILQLTKARPTLPLDGRSLVPKARNPAVGVGRELLFENFFPPSVGIRRGDWVYIEHATGETELYDLATDPWQLQSLHASLGLAGLRAQLAARLDQLRSCAGGACP
jgi:N-acetylglucosamine-6-sulfatase